MLSSEYKAHSTQYMPYPQIRLSFHNNSKRILSDFLLLRESYRSLNGISSFDLYRSLFMSTSVWYTLLSFYDLSEDTIIRRFERKSGHMSASNERDQLEGSSMSREAMLAHEREHKQAYKKGQWVCEYCKQPETQSTEGRLKACSKCKAVNLEVRYCNR